MEFRKIIKFGNNSYVISLPKNWITKNKIKKGDLVYLISNKNQILISPEKFNKDEEKKEIVIDCRNEKIETIRRKIISSYINNYKIITLLVNSNELAHKIREIIQNLMALEVIEQSSEKIIAKDYLNMDDISISNLIRKMDNIIRSIFQDLNISCRDNSFFKNIELCDNINSRDVDVNRLTFLIMRTIKYVISNPQLKEDQSDFDYFNYFELAQYLERIADELKRITRLLVTLDLNNADEIKNLCHDIEKLYLDTMKSFYNKDPDLAYSVATTKNQVLMKYTDVVEEYKENIIIIKLLEKLRNIINLVNSITRLVYQ